MKIINIITFISVASFPLAALRKTIRVFQFVFTFKHYYINSGMTFETLNPKTGKLWSRVGFLLDVARRQMVCLWNGEAGLVSAWGGVTDGGVPDS